jgi:DNA-directed RNA polymerase specialized sigma24 family protein
MADADDAVTRLIDRLRAGDEDAAERLWRRYFPRLVRLARVHLRGLPRRAADEEDVALGAFDSFRRGVEEGRFPRLTGRDALWDLLVTIALRHAAEWRQRETRQKRGGGAVRGDSALADGTGFDALAGDAPDPAFEAAMAERVRQLLDTLGDDELRNIAVWKMEGVTNEELADRLKCVVATVERRLRLIRAIWEREGGP